MESGQVTTKPEPEIAMLKSLLSFTALAALATQAHAIPILWSTGGTVNAVDTHYSITNSGTAPPEVALVAEISNTLNGAPLSNSWTAGGANRRGEWISPWIPGTDKNAWISDVSPFTYIYETIVGGTGTGLFAGIFAADNSGGIWVNNIFTTLTTPGFGAPGSPFSLKLSAGDVVQFRIVNSAGGGSTGNPAGLLVQVDSVLAVPDGGMTLVLLGSALSGLAYFRRKLA